MEERKLAAIMFADIVSYSRMMGEDEQQTLKLLHDFETSVTPMIQRKKGAVLKKVGDNLFCEFSSAINAVECAVQIQEFLHEYNKTQPENFQCRVRIGIHVGDVVKKENDLFGDGVNLTARIQPLAPAGGIYISQTVLSAIRSHARFRVVDRGTHKLKNIQQKQAVFQVLARHDAPPDETALETFLRTTRKVIQEHRIATYITTLLLLAIAIFTAKVAFFPSDGKLVQNQVPQTQPDSLAIANAALQSKIAPLLTSVDSARTEMSKEMEVAKAFGAPSQSAKLFRRAQDKMNLAEAHAAATTPDSLRTAIEAFAEAAEGFRNAKIFITNKAQLAEKVRTARENMRQVKDNLPGSRSEKETDENYQKAMARETKAQEYFASDDFGLALTATQEAKELYQASQISIAKQLRQVADQDKQEMLTAKQKIDAVKLAGDENLKRKFDQALETAEAGNSAYTENDYTKAAMHYNDARDAFEAVMSRLEVLEMTIFKAIESVKNDFEQSVNNEDISALAALFKNFSQDEEKQWQTFFGIVSDLTADVAIAETAIENNSASVELLAKFFYKNNKKQASEDNFTYTWKLEQIDSKWLIAKFDQRLIASK